MVSFTSKSKDWNRPTRVQLTETGSEEMILHEAEAMGLGMGYMNEISGGEKKMGVASRSGPEMGSPPSLGAIQVTTTLEIR